MPPILNAQSISKSFGATELFRNISLTVDDGARIGLIGPNGAGKSTLMAVLAGDVEPDAGEVAVRKRARTAYVAQESKFAAGAIIVREKLLTADAAVPELVTVMVKRDKGFSPKTGDWEYLIVEGALSKIEKREKTGSCSKCHAAAEQTDFVFKTYLK